MSDARNKIIEFVRTTKTRDEFSFFVRGNEEEAKKFIQCMRQELSRMRDIVKKRGHYPTPFKMNLSLLEHDETMGRTRIVLTRNRKNEIIAEEMSEIFDELAGGNLIEQ